MDERILNSLEKIGLTKQETRCYISLQELESAKSGEISKTAKIATANLYPVLNTLIQKGLVSYKIVNNIKIFFPASIDSLSEFIKKKQEKLDQEKEQIKEIITNFKKNNKKEPETNYKYFEGILGVKSLWNELANYMQNFSKTETLKIYGSSKESSINLRGFYSEFHKKRLALNQKYKLVTDIEDKQIINLRKKQNADIKTLKMKNESCFGKFKDVFFIVCQIRKKPIGFLIKNKIIAESFNQLYEQLWERIKN